MLLWLVILFARIRLDNQWWQDIFQILVGVGFSLARGAHDNIFTERLCPSLKYEEIYLGDYGSPREARQGIGLIRQLRDRRKCDCAGAESPRCWSVDRKTIIAKNFDLKAVNPNAPDDADRRTPAALLALIDAKVREVEEALTRLHKTTWLN